MILIHNSELQSFPEIKTVCMVFESFQLLPSTPKLIRQFDTPEEALEFMINDDRHKNTGMTLFLVQAAVIDGRP